MTPTDPDDAPAGAAPTTTKPAVQTPRSPPPEPEPRPKLSASERAARRRRRRTVAFWIVALAAVALALALIRCGGGFGFGDGGGLGRGGGGAGQGTGARGALSAPGRCQLRVDADGISLAGKPVSIDAAVAACIVASGAEIVVTGNARQGTWDDLRARLDAAGIASLVRLAGAPGPDAGTAAP